MVRTARVNVRIEPEVKGQAKQILDGLGLSFSDALEIFYREVIKRGKLPFEIEETKEKEE